MFNCRKDLTANEIYSLWGCGIQIFNVDLTVHDEMYLLNVKNAIKELQEMQKMIHYRPIALSITISLNDPAECDENVDIIILKDAMKRQDVIEFKKRQAKIVPNTPILLWIAELYIEDMDRLISVVDGVIVDSVNEDEIERRNLDFCPSALKICKETHKPIFFYNANIVEEYAGNQRRDILPFAQKVYNNRLDGVVLEDPKGKSSEVIQSLFTAICYLENISGPAKDCIEFSKQLKIPILPNLSVSVSACIAASKSKASAIILLTASGRSARWVACACPPCPVLAITTRASSARLIHIYRKVIPVLYTDVGVF
ncbi:pyruvate kinase 2-like [Hyposmocoma kahamanoa]|uniref:pyruvate kinase 2-like n=1 Tax=Hyposmocoma kahamanoa TaxID=1477025 RepID=UPI000E6D8F6F|nr:pyruvate kinase 2-like [Hyposmocoma kahamanoa]